MAEQFSYIFGDKLCDNQWHSVRLTRDKHKVTIHLDKQPTDIVKIEMSHQYNTQYRLLIDVRIYVGGTWKTTNELKHPIVKNFVGCLGDVLFNAFHLITDAQRKKKAYTTTGTISYTCPTTEYKPISFLNKMAYLKVPSPDQSRVSIELMFRTYDKNGILMHRDGPKLSTYLYLEDGRLKFEYNVPGEKQLTLDIDAHRPRYRHFNDGEWHLVKASIGPNAMIFRVDNGTETNTAPHKAILNDPSSLDFENITYVGGGTYYKRMYGLVGCMKDLRVNNAKINLVKLPKKIAAVYVEAGKCTLRSFCHPSPCQYKSRCEQRNNNFTCICKKFYRGRYCEVPSFQATCHGYKELGMNEDAYCRVDPDGKGPLPEFRVLCNMTDGADAVTIVNHTSSTRQVKVREEAYTFSAAVRSWAHKLDYGVELKNLRALVDESDHCRQYVEFNCINTKFLTPRGKDLPGAYWVSFDGVGQHYWGGTKRGGVSCACGTTSSCHDRSKMCNCDTGDGVWRQDAGYLTNKDHLPVAAIYFPMSAGNSNFTVGPLECFGRKQLLTRETDEKKFFGIACQPLVTKPPPVYPWQLTKAAKVKSTSQRAITLPPTSNATTKAVKPNSGTKGWSEVNLRNGTHDDHYTNKTSPTSTEKKNSSFFPVNQTEHHSNENFTWASSEKGNSSFLPVNQTDHHSNENSTSSSTEKSNSSFLPVNPTDHILVDVANAHKNEKESNGWLFILIITTSSFLFILVIAFLFLVVRHKQKNGVWCKGLFITKTQPFPKIEIYRHSLITDTPDILHMEDFKNTKVVDVQFHRGHFVAKKNGTKKKAKTVTFKDRC